MDFPRVLPWLSYGLPWCFHGYFMDAHSVVNDSHGAFMDPNGAFIWTPMLLSLTRMVPPWWSHADP